jgi:hypothetical protein
LEIIHDLSVDWFGLSDLIIWSKHVGEI